MKIKHIASSSKANAFTIDTNNNIIVIDAGVKGLPCDIFCLTHVHGDHFKYFQEYIYKCRVFITTVETYESVIKQIDPLTREILDQKYMIDDFCNEYTEGKLRITTYPLFHDKPCSSFVIEYEGEKYVHITDTVDVPIIDHYKNAEYYSIEANHSTYMLKNGTYNNFLKYRIKDKGHLSNEHTAEILGELVGNRTKLVSLIHLSSNNNRKELAEMAVKKVFDNVIVPEGEVEYDTIQTK